MLILARIIYKDNKKEVKDGESITQACEELGVAFGCYAGDCGLCKIEILEGEDNLNDLTEKEQNNGMNKKNRLACQCKIKSGEVKIRF